jgi:hypothetical protein
MAYPEVLIKHTPGKRNRGRGLDNAYILLYGMDVFIETATE